MEINTQQMEALLRAQERQAQLPRQQSGAASGFEALLNKQMESGEKNAAQTIAQTLAGAPAATIFNQLPLDGAEEKEALDPDSEVLKAAFEQASGALDLWDSYARTLGTSTNDTALRDAWGLLEGIDARMAQMRDNPARGRSSALDAILNELEIMTAAEKFKFNRGDYI